MRFWFVFNIEEVVNSGAKRGQVSKADGYLGTNLNRLRVRRLEYCYVARRKE